MTFEIEVGNPKYVLKMLFGSKLELVNGNLTFGEVTNLRMEQGKLLADCEIKDTYIFENYGSKGRIGGFPAKVHP